MTWIKVEAPTPTKPEVMRLARELGVTRDDAFGKAMRFWLWLDGVTVDGRVDGVTSQDVDAIVDAQGFAIALQASGWLVIEAETPAIFVPNFERHNGESSKLRALKTKRQQRWRKKNVDGDASTTASTREEKIREEKNIGEVSPITTQTKQKRQRRIALSAVDILDGLAVPTELSTDSGIAAVREWLAHKDRIRDQYASKDSFQVELRRWAKLGAERFAAAVTYSVGKEWKGIYEENGNGQRSSGRKEHVRDAGAIHPDSAKW